MERMARRFLQDMVGQRVWLAFGNVEVTGFVLTADARSAQVQDSTSGEVRQVVYAAIEEMVEA